MTWIHENFGDRAEGKVTKGDKIAFVRRWFPVCFDTGENMTDCLKQLDDIIAAALTEAESENRKLKEEVEKANERTEMTIELLNKSNASIQNWLSFSGGQDKEISSLQSKLGEARKIMEFMAGFSPHCCEDCPCDEFRRKAAEFLEPPAEGKGTKEPKP